jgi:hypothetical protein
VTALNLAQRLALVKFLTESLAALRTTELLPQSEAEMPPGSRLPVMFSGRQAGWASMPQPSQGAAYVADEKKLLAWAEINYPDKVGVVETVPVTDELLAHLEEHLPSAIVKTRQVDPQWVSDITKSLKDPGWYRTNQGEKLTEVPGIVLPEPGKPVPHVKLEGFDAAGIIGAAWRDGDIPVAEFLALPAADGQDAA